MCFLLNSVIFTYLSIILLYRNQRLIQIQNESVALKSYYAWYCVPSEGMETKGQKI